MIDWLESPLRYPGSKRQTAGEIIKQLGLHSNNPLGIFIEPFAGGASTSIRLLSSSMTDYVILSDIDPLIFSFWKTVFGDGAEDLMDFIKKVKVTTDNFYKFRNFVNTPGRKPQIELAKACIFLNRTSFSGIISNSAGPIGGRKQISDYKVDCRFNKNDLIEKIDALNKFRDRVCVLNTDWETTIKISESLIEKIPIYKNSQVYYLDPPFFYKADKLYRHYFEAMDHERLMLFLKRFNRKWLLSYDKADEIIEMYKPFSNILKLKLRYSAATSGQTKKTKELLISRSA